MKKLHAKLSLDQRADALKQAMASPNAKPGRYADTRNVYLKVSKTGAKSWVFMFQKAGKQYEIGLGSFTGAGSTLALTSTKQAQVAADKIRVASEAFLRDTTGTEISPTAAKKQAKAKVEIITFRALMEDYILKVVTARSKTEQASKKNVQQWRNSLRDHAGLILDMPVTEITVEHIRTIVLPIWSKRKIGEGVRSRIAEVLGAAKATGKVPTNVAEFKDNLKQLLPPKPKKADAKKHNSLSWKKLPALVQRLAKQEEIDAKALLNAILSGGRTDETLSMRHVELALDHEDGPRWIIPADRMKANKEHIVMLSTQHVTLLRSIDKVDGNPFVFVGPKDGKLPPEALRKTLTRMGVKNTEAVPHGFRSTFINWAGDDKRHSVEIAEMAVAHSVAGVRKHYRDRPVEEVLAELTQDYADHAFGANVVPLKVAA